MLVAMDGVGRVKSYVEFLNALRCSSSLSTGRILCVNLRGSGIYTGKFSKVHLKPERAGLAGLKGTSCTIAGAVVILKTLRGIGMSSPNTILPELKCSVVLTLCEKGFS